MRIELKHKPSCPSSKKLRNFLEGIIAEERLPLVVEATETEGKDSPTVHIHASGAASEANDQHEIKCENSGDTERQFLDKLRQVVLEKWHDHAVFPLSHLR